MRVLIGYSMRSGSTVLAHALGGHSRVRACGDPSSLAALPRLPRPARDHTLVVEPPDLCFLSSRLDPLRYFDCGIWLVRDPRDSYLSTLESGYACLFRPPGPHEGGLDIGLLRRWARIQQRYLDEPGRWYLLRYEDLVRDPLATLARLQDHLELPREVPLPFRFRRRDFLRGGDHKIARTRHLSGDGIGRHADRPSAEQQALFARYLEPEMGALGYRIGPPAGRQVPAVVQPPTATAT